jgi:chemotaxis signal transduction protein
MHYYLSFLINDIALGVPIEEVQEIARPKSMSVKKKNGFENLLGYFKLRGVHVPLYDLPSYLALKQDKKAEVIIISHMDIMIGVQVGKVRGIVAAAKIVPYPDLIPRRSFFLGVVPGTEPLLQVISLSKIFTRQRIKKIQTFLAQQSM